MRPTWIWLQSMQMTERHTTFALQATQKMHVSRQTTLIRPHNSRFNCSHEYFIILFCFFCSIHFFSPFLFLLFPSKPTKTEKCSRRNKKSQRRINCSAKWSSRSTENETCTRIICEESNCLLVTCWNENYIENGRTHAISVAFFLYLPVKCANRKGLEILSRWRDCAYKKQLAVFMTWEKYGVKSKRKRVR